ncbi:MAG: stage II sporulation protein P, partial [Clostridium sp.]
MLSRNNRSVKSKVIVFLVGILLMVKIFLPLLSMGLTENSKHIFIQILGKSNGSIEEHVFKTTQEDEENIDLTSYVIKNLTGLDLSTPTNLLSSQIPLLGLIDISKLDEINKEPVVVEKTEVLNKKDNKIKTPAKEIDHSRPEILIYHTHTTEGYNPEKIKGKNFTTDLTKTVANLGDKLEKQLEEKYGIATIHDKTIHDIPKREGAYSKSRPTVQKHLKENKYKLIIDLHRDGGVPASKATVTINGQRVARPMFVFGSKNKNIEKSEKMAHRLNDEIEKLVPKFSRGFLYHKNSVFNQDLSSNIVLLEVGSNENTLEEAQRTIDIIANAVAN